MARGKAHTAEEIVAKLRQIEVLVGQGKAEAVSNLTLEKESLSRLNPDCGSAASLAMARFSQAVPWSRKA
ncbi:hypothetical protein [Belnapia rosea]|uniref:hypothetical protein n=1 Tax=Belnapia rosea TaxID=938405 RepID=UPI0008887FB2|nr:hypothetical protein [Belnapia rosea]SDB74388.1 hypothetical protein SAMN02927895_05183 [Belnapia rosea]